MRDEILLAPPFRIEEEEKEVQHDGPGAYYPSPVYGRPGANNPWIRKSHNVYIQDTMDQNTDSWIRATTVRSQNHYTSNSADMERRKSRRPVSAAPAQSSVATSARLPKKNLNSRFNRPNVSDYTGKASRSNNTKRREGKDRSMHSPAGSIATGQEDASPRSYSIDALSRAIANTLKTEGGSEFTSDAVRNAVERSLAHMKDHGSASITTEQDQTTRSTEIPEEGNKQTIANTDEEKDRSPIHQVELYNDNVRSAVSATDNANDESSGTEDTDDDSGYPEQTESVSVSMDTAQHDEGSLEFRIAHALGSARSSSPQRSRGK